MEKTILFGRWIYGDAILAAAGNYPEQKYAIIDNDYGDATPDNDSAFYLKKKSLLT